MKGRRSCHLRVGGRRKGADGADDARRGEKLEKSDHICVHVSSLGGAFGKDDQIREKWNVSVTFKPSASSGFDVQMDGRPN